MLNLSTVYTMAKKEFLDSIRNRWVIILVSIFVILTIASSFLAGQQQDAGSLGDMEETVVTLISIATFLVPLISIFLGFATISGEAESGSLSLVLSYPVRRSEILLGKFLGLSAILAFTSVAGFGLGGLVIAVTSGGGQAVGYLGFIALTIVFGLTYLSPMIMLSSLLKRRVTSIGGGIFLFLWSPIYGMITFGVFLATSGSMDQLLTGFDVPDWMWASMVLSPSDTYQTAVMQAFGIEQAFGFPVEAPAFMSVWLLLFFSLLWILIPLGLAYLFFKRRDL